MTINTEDFKENVMNKVITSSSYYDLISLCIDRKYETLDDIPSDLTSKILFFFVLERLPEDPHYSYLCDDNASQFISDMLSVILFGDSESVTNMKIATMSYLSSKFEHIINNDIIFYTDLKKSSEIEKEEAMTKANVSYLYQRKVESLQSLA
jgi:hypothetical protein